MGFLYISLNFYNYGNLVVNFCYTKFWVIRIKIIGVVVLIILILVVILVFVVVVFLLIFLVIGVVLVRVLV